jgi:hypothetical protein
MLKRIGKILLTPQSYFLMQYIGAAKSILHQCMGAVNTRKKPQNLINVAGYKFFGAISKVPPKVRVKN